MPKIAQKVDGNWFLCYNNSIRNGGSYSYFFRKIKIFLFNLVFQFLKYLIMKSFYDGRDFNADFYLSWRETIAWTKSSETTLRRAIKNKTFPKPEPLFANCGKVGFRKPHLMMWANGKRDW